MYLYVRYWYKIAVTEIFQMDCKWFFICFCFQWSSRSYLLWLLPMQHSHCLFASEQSSKLLDHYLVYFIALLGKLVA